jgi:hypothetical protein
MTCPHCGYCDKCGRSNRTYPYQYPYWQPSYPYVVWNGVPVNNSGSVSVGSTTYSQKPLATNSYSMV